MALVSLSETSIICSVKIHGEEDMFHIFHKNTYCTWKFKRLRTKLDDAKKNAWLDALRLLDDLIVFVFGQLVDIEECLWCNYPACNSNISSKSTHTSHSHYRASKRNSEKTKKTGKKMTMTQLPSEGKKKGTDLY